MTPATGRAHRAGGRLALALAVAMLVACMARPAMRPVDGAAPADASNPASVQSRTQASPPPQPPASAAQSPAPEPSPPPPSPSQAAVHAFQPSACAACHGVDGEGQASGYPALAGQGRWYLARQLRDYRDGRRVDPIMQPIASSLTDATIDAAAAWYGALPARRVPRGDAVAPAPGGPRARGDAVLDRAGARLAQGGDARRQIVACDNCHGPQGQGLPPAVPRLAGQQEAYLRTQLLAWRRGTRHNDAGGAMRAAASELADRDIAAVARWYASRLPASSVATVGRVP